MVSFEQHQKLDAIDDLYTFLQDNYIMNDKNYYKLDYHRDLLTYFLEKDSITLFAIHQSSIIGCVCARKCTLNIQGTPFSSGEVNFLCVRKDYRKQHIASLLIKKIEDVILKEWKDVQISNYTVDNSTWTSVDKYTSKHHYYRILSVENLQKTGLISVDKERQNYLQKYYSDVPLQPYSLSDNYSYIVTEGDFSSVYTDYSNHFYYFNPIKSTKNDVDALYTFYQNSSKKLYKIYEDFSLETFSNFLDNKQFDCWHLTTNDNTIVAWFCFFHLRVKNTEMNTSHNCMYLYNYASLIKPKHALNYVCKTKLNTNTDLIVIPDIFESVPDQKYIKSDSILNYYLYRYPGSLECKTFENALCTI